MGFRCYIFFMVVLGFELRALQLLGSLSFIYVLTPAFFFCFSYFWDRILHFCQHWPGPQSSVYAFCIAGMIGTHYHAQLLVEMGSC
jgi:hypothetical protein